MLPSSFFSGEKTKNRTTPTEETTSTNTHEITATSAIFPLKLLQDQSNKYTDNCETNWEWTMLLHLLNGELKKKFIEIRSYRNYYTILKR